MKKKIWLRGLVGVGVLASLILLVACGGPTKKAATPTLNVTMGLSDEEWKVMNQDVLPAFEKESGIKVNAIQMEAADVAKKLQASVAAKKNDIDVISQDVNTTAQLVADGYMADLSDQTKIIPSSTYPIQKQVGVFNGKTYFLPYRPNVEINYYNKTKFDKYGLQPPTNWDELLTVAKTLKAKEGIGRVAFKMSGDVIELVEFIRSAGGDPLNLNDAGTITALTYLQKLMPFLSDDTLKGTFSTTNTFLAKDEVYYMPNWPFATNIIVGDGGRKDIHATAGFAGPKKAVKTLGGEVLGVVKGTKNKTAALKFIKYLESKKVQQLLLKKNGWPSFRADVTGTVTGWQAPYYQATDAALKIAQPLPNVTYMPDVNKLINDIFQETCVQGKDVKTVLQDYQPKLAKIKAEAKKAQ